jgi:hypothetical protein
MHLCLQDHTDLTIYLITQELQVPEKNKQEEMLDTDRTQFLTRHKKNLLEKQQ